MNFKEYYFKEEEYLEVDGEPVYINATPMEINRILRNPNSYGVRIGVISPDEIYYWDAEIPHYKMASFIKKFKLELTYGKDMSYIMDWGLEEKHYKSKNKIRYSEEQEQLRRKISPILISLFPKIQQDEYRKYR